jgi:hypothetical protein
VPARQRAGECGETAVPGGQAVTGFGGAARMRNVRLAASDATEETCLKSGMDKMLSLM